MTAQQDAIDAVAGDLNNIHSELDSGIQELKDELAAQNVTVDLSKLEAARDGLKVSADALPQAPADPPPAG